MGIAIATLAWSNERLMVYSINPYIFNTVGGQKDYLLGPGSPVLTFTNIVGGSLYTNGFYPNISLTGSATGTGCIATVTVAGNVVTNVQLSVNQDAGGMGYKVGDTLTASNTDLGGFGSGFTVDIASVGPGDWNITRPLRIEQAYVIWNDPTSAQAVDLPVQLLTDSEFAAISVKNTPSSFPFALYDNGNYPLKTVSVWPVPSTPTGMRMWLRQPLVDFTNLDQLISYPPGYERAFRFCLAVEIAPEFAKTVDPVVAQTALKAKQDLASMNSEPQHMCGDGGLSAGRIPFNWITGGFSTWGPR